MAGSSFFVVDHVSDPQKTDGIVESYTMVPVQYDTEQGPVQGIRRMNFVHWPEIPVPFVHQEWSEDLQFSNVYVPELDNGDDDDDEDYEDEDQYLDDGSDDDLTYEEEEEIQE
jgi:hypothetical protein